MKKSIVLFLLLFSLTFLVNGQQTNFSHSIKTSVFFGNKLRVIVSYGLNYGSHIDFKNSNAITPFIDVKVNLYRIFLGSSVVKEYQNLLNGNIAISPGVYYSNNQLKQKESLIPIFSSSFANTFNSSYRNNIGLNTTYIFQFGIGKNEPYKRFQRVANFFASCGNFYMNYYNDGGPILKYFGDVEDRYWTGGLIIGCLATINQQRHSFEISFDKYTGFTKNAFEATGLLYVDNVVYRDFREVSYNTGKYSFSYTNLNKDVGVSINKWNSKIDFQDLLHRNVTYNPYHHKLEKPYFDFTIFNSLAL